MKSDFYFDFENRFRGKSESILDQFSMYDSLVDTVISHNNSPRFIDIGSGRGEWISKWSNSTSSCIGIEYDPAMVSFCRNKNFNIIEGDALDTLKQVDSSSASLITMFHIIEHIAYDKLFKIVNECYRVLNDNGVLILETPSIDNLLVSSKLFYLDHTHINHINPEGFKFSLEKSGFKKVKYYYIHGGPLQIAEHLKITRVLNGVAQDVFFLAVKSHSFSRILFEEDKDWELGIKCSPTLLESAVDFDLMHEKVLGDLTDRINKLYENNSNINQLRIELKPIFVIIKILRRFIYPILTIFRLLKKYILFMLTKIFKFVLSFKFLRNLILTDYILYLINFILKYIFGSNSKVNKNHILNTLNKTGNNSQKFIMFNKNLLIHNRNSKISNKYSKMLQRKK